MSFAAFPLWALIGMAVAASGAVVALYLLRRTPRPQVVSNVEFWLRAAQSARPKWLFSTRIPLVALLLSLLAALLLVVLLGDPRFGSGVRGTTIVVLDAGVTMDATGVDGERRLDRALLEVRRWVERTTITGEVAVVRAGMRPSVLLPITDDAADLERALGELEVDDGASDLAGAVALADAILAEHGALAAGTGQILVVADEGLDGITARAPMVLLPVGSAADTVAITGFAARRVPAAVGEYVARVEVTAFTARDARARVVVRDGDVTILDERVELEAHEPLVLEAGGFSSARAELVAELREIEIPSARDGLGRDDRAYAVVEPLEATRVLLVSDGNRYLEAALAAHPGLDVEVIGTDRITSVPTVDLARYHALVLDGVTLTSAEHGAQLVFAPPARGAIRLEAPVARPPVTATLASHPALDGLRLDAMHLARATPIVELPGDQVLVRSGDRALAVARQSARARMVAFGFDLEDTDLVRGETFPLLVHSALRWVTERDEPTPLARRLGGTLVADSGQTVRGPNGEVLDVPGVVPGVTEAGIWYAGDRAIAYGATEHARSLGAGATGGRFATRSTLPPLAILVAAALLALLLFEWLLLHRGRLE